MEKLNILLIEDDLIIATELKAELEDAGHMVPGIARNAEEAMKLIKIVPPDIALIDITLGKIEDGGIRIAREILNHLWMPIIYLTAHSDMKMVEKASTTIPAAYMLKPYRIVELLAQIKLAFNNFQKSSDQTSLSPVPIRDGFYLPIKNGHERVLSKDILGIKSQGNCTELYVIGELKPRLIGTHLGHFATYLPVDIFFRLSRSYIINLNHLVRVERTQLYLGSENFKIEITESNRKQLMKKLTVIRMK